jgi:uncharacterized protein (DUF1330 family)
MAFLRSGRKSRIGTQFTRPGSHGNTRFPHSRFSSAARNMGHRPSPPSAAGGKRMPAYWVARSKINDPVEYKKYTDRLPAIFARYGAKILARGGRYQLMEGPDKFHRFVVIEFPTFDQGVACFTSPEYEEAAAFRRSGAGEVETVIVDGGDATR